MNYFDSEHVYLALPSVFWYFWRDTASSLVPGGVWRVKRASFGPFPGLICRSVALERQSPERRWPGSQCHRVGSAFSTSGIPCRTSSFYFGFEGFCSSLPSPVVTMGFFFQTSEFLLGVWCVGFFPFRQDRPLPTAMTAVTGPNPCDKRTLLIITSVTSYCWFNSQTCGCSLNFNFFFFIWGFICQNSWCRLDFSLSRAYFLFLRASWVFLQRTWGQLSCFKNDLIV